MDRDRAEEFESWHEPEHDDLFDYDPLEQNKTSFTPDDIIECHWCKYRFYHLQKWGNNTTCPNCGKSLVFDKQNEPKKSHKLFRNPFKKSKATPFELHFFRKWIDHLKNENLIVVWNDEANFFVLYTKHQWETIKNGPKQG